MCHMPRDSDTHVTSASTMFLWKQMTTSWPGSFGKDKHMINYGIPSFAVWPLYVSPSCNY